MIDGYEFTFRGEYEPDFKCAGKFMGDALHIAWFTNPPKHLVSFPSLATGGKSTMIITQRLDRSIHVLVK